VCVCAASNGAQNNYDFQTKDISVLLTTRSRQIDVLEI
jgi:hypothetical protein